MYLLKLCLKILALFTLGMLHAECGMAQYDSISHDGIDRTYLLHLPAGYTGNNKLPLIIAMHGGLGNAYNIQNQSGLSEKADAGNFIVVYPEGVKGGVLQVRTWNAGWCCGYASDSNIDDVGFIDALMDTLISRYPVDTNRIYATGMSNGGFMSYRLACELSERIAAIAPVSASMSMTDCNPSRPVPVIHFHSYQDTNVPYEGGIGNGISDHYNPPVDSVLNVWAADNNCVVLNDTVLDNDQYTFVKWSSCDCGSEIHYYITTDGGHSWPGGEQTPIGDPVSEYLNANDLMWSFFQLYSLDCEPSASKEVMTDHLQLKVFPNPSSGIVSLEIPETRFDYTINVYDPYGRMIDRLQNNASIDLSDRPSGIYLIEFKSGFLLARKMIMIH